MFPLEPRNPTHLAKAQEKDVKIDFMDMIEVLKEEMNKSLKEIQEKHKQGKEINKNVQDLN